MMFSCRWFWILFWAGGLSPARRAISGRLFDGCEIDHGFTEQTINWVFLPSLRLDEQRPILVRFHLVAGDILLPKFIRALGVLDNELAVHDGPDQRIGRAHFADARPVAAETAVSRRILRRAFLKRLAVFLRNEMIQRAIVGRFDL